MAAPLHYDPFAEEVIQDPHPIYKRLREEAPCYHVEKWDCYALSRFDDIWTASMDADNYSAAAGTTASHLLTKVQPVTPSRSTSTSTSTASSGPIELSADTPPTSRIAATTGALLSWSPWRWKSTRAALPHR